SPQCPSAPAESTPESFLTEPFTQVAPLAAFLARLLAATNHPEYLEYLIPHLDTSARINGRPISRETLDEQLHALIHADLPSTYTLHRASMDQDAASGHADLHFPSGRLTRYDFTLTRQSTGAPPLWLISSLHRTDFPPPRPRPP